MVIKGKLTLLQKSAGKVVGQFEVTIWMPSQPRRYSDDITEPSAVAPDARVTFVVEQIGEHVKVQLITKLTLASGATALGSVLTASLHVSSFDDSLAALIRKLMTHYPLGNTFFATVTVLLLQEGRKKLICQGRIYCS